MCEEVTPKRAFPNLTRHAVPGQLALTLSVQNHVLRLSFTGAHPPSKISADLGLEPHTVRLD